MSREPYFVGDTQRADWKELLCCPSAMGCTVVRFDAGEAQYKVFLRLSQNAHVPRYQLQVVSQGKTKEWVVGHMYKTETHLRTKPGEFIRVQVWNLTSNGMEWVERRNSLNRRGGLLGSAVQQRPTPKASDMRMMGMAITTQAKLEPQKQTAGEKKQRVKYDKDSERWVQSIAVDDENYRLKIDKVEKSKAEKGDEESQERLHSRLESMSVLRVRHNKRTVCVAKKQRFAGTPGNVCQPFLGVQIAPTGSTPDRSPPDPDLPDLSSFLDSRGLMLLLLCLAWSEETMSPVIDASQKFINAMRANPGEPGSAEDLKLSEQWNTDDVKQRLRHIPYAAFHNWMGGDDIGEDDDVASLPDGEEDLRGSDSPPPPPPPGPPPP